MSPPSALHALRARKPRPLKVLIAQLPIQELAFRRVRGNELVAPSYLAASLRSWAAARGRAREVEVELLPREVVDRLGDAALARAIAARAPDVLGFACFLWNSHRTIALACAVKRLLPEVAVVVGGPEITRDNPWLVQDPAVDLGVVGEGEATFCELIEWLLGGGPASLDRILGLAIPPRAAGRLPVVGEPSLVYTPVRPAADLARVPSPYLSGIIEPAFDGQLSLETLRGCPFRCSFCYYFKQFEKVNAFPRGWLRDHFRYARDHGVTELIFLDPTLNARPRFSEFLDEVIAANEDGALELHAELVADMVDEKIADKLERAHFVGVECGLQSIHPKVLKAVNRFCDPERFARGVTHMDRRGIVVKTDLIIGLPEDTEEGVRRSIDWVRERKLDADVQVFHLMVLPGTELREKADAFGYEWQARPPYYATRTRWMDDAAMRRVIERAGEVFDVEFDPPARTLLGAAVAEDARAVSSAEELAGAGYWSRTTLDLARVASADDARELGRAAGESAASALTVVLESGDLARDLAKATAFLEELARANPFGTFDVVACGGGLSLETLSALKSAAATPDAYLNGYHRFQVPEGTLVSTRVSALVAAREPVLDLEELVPVIYRIDARSAQDLDERLDALPGRAVLIGRAGLALAPERLARKLETRFEDDPDAVSLERAEDARAWDRLREVDPLDAPPEVLLLQGRTADATGVAATLA